MICEELSRHGDLMRDLAEIGLSPESCEQWFERAVVVFVGVMFIIIVIRVSDISSREPIMVPFLTFVHFLATPRDCGVKLLPAAIPYLEGFTFKRAQRQRPAAHLPPSDLG